MPTRTIKITGSDITNGDLDLTNHGRNDALRGDTIIWHVDNHSGVDKIVSMAPKSGSSDIFRVQPGPVGGSSRNWTAVINNTVPIGTDYHYSITWNRGANNYDCDPILSIKPSIPPDGSIFDKIFGPRLGPILGPIIALLGIVTSIVTIVINRRMKQKNEILRKKVLDLGGDPDK